jgi:predicted RNA binding protein YcfA (HicA-like mRNA interferase family)
MTRLPTLRPKQVIRALERTGFQHHRQSGSHLTMKHPDGRLAILPIHSSDLKREVMKAIIKQVGLSEEEFRKLL